MCHHLPFSLPQRARSPEIPAEHPARAQRHERLGNPGRPPSSAPPRPLNLISHSSTAPKPSRHRILELGAEAALRRRVLGVPQHLRHREALPSLRRGTKLLAELSFPDPGPAVHGDSSGGAPSSHLCAASIPPRHRRSSTSVHGYRFTRG